MHRYIRVALLGRVNVGKSTLLNGLACKHVAVVGDQPGVTRDGKVYHLKHGQTHIELMDTAGFLPLSSTLETQIWEHTKKKIASADILGFVVDAQGGLTAQDQELARYVRTWGKPCHIIANKSDRCADLETICHEFASLGWKDIFSISAMHRRGLEELKDFWCQHGYIQESVPPAITLAVLGRPNVGKSSLLNMILRKDTLLSGPQAGLTRDAVPTCWHHKGKVWKLVDTAGLRRKKRVHDALETQTHKESFHALMFAHVVALVIEPCNTLDKQDVILGQKIIQEGRSFVLVVNKSDTCTQRHRMHANLIYEIAHHFPEMKGMSPVWCSAREGQGRRGLIDALYHAYDQWNTQIPTAQLNVWWQDISQRYAPPSPSAIKYVTQVRTRPLTLGFFGRNVGKIPSAYRRYVMNRVREAWGLQGTPVRCLFQETRSRR